jgi:hypothetical protein
MRLCYIVAQALIAVTSTVIFGAESIEDILQSDAPKKEKRELIIKALQTSFQAAGQLPKFATKSTLESHFRIFHVEAGRPPFEMGYYDILYCIEYAPKTDENHFKLFFSSERRVAEDWLLDLISTDSNLSEQFKIMRVFFLK